MYPRPAATSRRVVSNIAPSGSLGAFALSEEHAGSDAANQQSIARLDERGYVISGRKVWVGVAQKRLSSVTADVAAENVQLRLKPELPMFDLASLTGRIDVQVPRGGFEVRGHRLALWFSNTFGSTLCGDITQCDFAKVEDTERYIESGCVERCRVTAGSGA